MEIRKTKIMKEIKLVIFDMDGLLINSERHMWTHNSEILINKLGYKFDFEWHRRLMGCSFDHYKQSSLELYGKDFPFDSFYQELIKKNQESLEKKEVPLMDGAIEILEYLNNKNIPYTITTSTKKELVTKMLESCDISKYFNVITTGDEVENGKPYPDIYLKTISKYNIPKENILVLEDGSSGFHAAYDAGLSCAIVEDIAILDDFTRKNAFVVVHSLKEIINIIEENNIK